MLILCILGPSSALAAENASTPPQSKKSASIDGLYAQFQDPPRQYTLHPYLFMNGKLDPARLTKQMQIMDNQGVYSTTVYGIDGLRTPYLSNDWFDNFGAMLAEAKRLNFELDFNADYDWPDGEARNPYALQPVQSRVIQADPSFQMRSLAYVEKDVEGPTTMSLTTPDQIQFAVAAASPQSGRLDGDSLKLIQQEISGEKLVWKVPQGHWKVMAFYLKVAEGAQKDNVDKLNPKATQTFIKIGLDPYYERFGSSFGKNIRSLLMDHEGDYGRRIAWTPGIFEAFEKEKGYDLRKYLPLLVYEGGRLTPKVRNDYLDFISHRYIDSFFNPIIDWARARNIEAIAQLWESPLMVNPAVEGNFFAIERQFSKTGVDALLDTYKWPRDFMEAASISHFDKKDFGVEALGIQGYNSFIDLGGMRNGTYMIGAWGGSYLWALFNYDSQKANYPPDWFYVQPYWKYFKAYADAVRRMSFMNSGGSKVASIAIYQPLEAIYAESSPIFNHDVVYPFGGGSKIAPLTEQNYSELIWGLSKQQWNYDIMDAHYLAQAGIEKGALSLGGDHYRVLLLPTATTIRRDTFKKIEQFFDAGGVVIALGNLPKNSVEYGENDPELEKMVRSIFGDEIGRTPSSLNRSAAGGQA
ncbi:MAG: glycosyl hydrolase, partial [Acidobacteriaceae bacterium]